VVVVVVVGGRIAAALLQELGYVGLIYGVWYEDKREVFCEDAEIIGLRCSDLFGGRGAAAVY
jgi:hypothetical protein